MCTFVINGVTMHRFRYFLLPRRCTDRSTQVPQASLRKFIPKRTVSYLNPSESLTQFQRSRSFMDGLNQVSEVFRGAFRKTARGMAKPQWSLPGQSESVRRSHKLITMQDATNGARDTGRSTRRYRAANGETRFCRCCSRRCRLARHRSSTILLHAQSRWSRGEACLLLTAISIPGCRKNGYSAKAICCIRTKRH